MARPLGSYVSGAPDWLAARQRRVGGSDIGAVMGHSPFVTRDNLLWIKAGLMPPQSETEAMWRGTVLEPAVITYLLKRHQLEIDVERSATTWVADDDDRLLYNPDGITTTNVLLEAKTTSDRATERGWGRAGTDQIPRHYLEQVTWGMGLLGMDTCHLGVLAGGVNGRPSLAFASYTVRFAPDLFAELKSAAHQFLSDLDHLVEGITA